MGLLAADQLTSDFPNPTYYVTAGGLEQVNAWVGEANQFHMAGWCIIENVEGEFLYTIPDVVTNIQVGQNLQPVTGLTLPGSVATSPVLPGGSTQWPAGTVLNAGGSFTPTSAGYQYTIIVGAGTLPNPDPLGPTCLGNFSYQGAMILDGLTPTSDPPPVPLHGVRNSLTSLTLTSGNDPYQVDGGGGGDPNMACSITVAGAHGTTVTLSYANCLAPSLSPNGILPSPANFTFSSPVGNSPNAPGAMGLYVWSDSHYDWPLNQTELPVPDALQTSYVVGLESDWGQANNSSNPCKLQSISGVKYSGQIPGVHTPAALTAPASLPGPGPWCAAALGQNILNGTMLYDEEQGNELYNWSRKRVVAAATGSDGKPVVANETVACDRTALIPRHTTNTIHIDNIGDRSCNDSGGGIKGYHIDNFVGIGKNASLNWQHNSEVDTIGCTPGDVSIDNSCPAPLNFTGVSPPPTTPWSNWPAISRRSQVFNKVQQDSANREALLKGLQP